MGQALRSRSRRLTTGEHIQALVDSAADEARDAVTLPEGVTYVETPIVLRGGVDVRGHPNGSVVELVRDANCHVLTNADWETGDHSITLRDFVINGNGEHQDRPADHTAATFACGIYLAGSVDVCVRGVQVMNVRQTGLHVSNCDQVDIRDLRAERVGWSGFAAMNTGCLHAKRVTVSAAGLDVLHSGVHIDGGGFVSLVGLDVSACSGNALMFDSLAGPLVRCFASGVLASCLRGAALVGSVRHPLRNVRLEIAARDNDVGVMMSNATDITLDKSTVTSNRKIGVSLEGRTGVKRTRLLNTLIADNPIGVREHGDSALNFASNVTLRDNGVDLDGRSDSPLRRLLGVR